jgi:endonuclease I
MAVLLALASPVFAQYDPPAGYYNSAVGLTGAPLKAALNNIIDGNTSISYSNREGPLEALDQDPNNSANVLEVYSGFSVPKTDFLPGVTPANTEHLWCNAYGIDMTNPAYGALFNLRPCDMNVNSDRADKFYDDGGTAYGPEAPLCHFTAVSWESRPVEKGDIARCMFYMDTRYEGDGTDGFARNLTLVEDTSLITGSNNNFGKLSTLVLWSYGDPVSTEEQIRNHTIYTTYQHNRNPFTDHPEYVWAIYGASPNDSRLYLGAIEPGDGASAASVDLGTVIVDAALPGSQNVTLNKSGANPTTYNVTLAGQATSTAAGTRQTFLGGAQNRSIAAGLSASTATAGLQSGTITIDNTDLTSSGAGHGSTDGDDVINVSLSVLDHANGSFESPTDQDTLTIDFGSVPQGSGPHTINFAVYNLESTPGFTAALDLDSVISGGDVDVLTTDLAPQSNLAAGGSLGFSAMLSSNTLGSFSATYTISGSDQDLPGAQPTADLVLTLVGEVFSACTAADADCDATVSINDVEPFVNDLLGTATPCSPCAADMNGDTVLNGNDIPSFIAALGI